MVSPRRLIARDRDRAPVASTGPIAHTPARRRHTLPSRAFPGTPVPTPGLADHRRAHRDRRPHRTRRSQHSDVASGGRDVSVVGMHPGYPSPRLRPAVSGGVTRSTRWSVLGIFLGGFVLSALGCKARLAENVVARAFTLVDSAGHVTARLSTVQGGPRLELLDARQRPRATLFLESNGTPDLYLYDTHGKARFAADLCDSGTGNTAYLSADGHMMALAYLGSDRHFKLALVDVGHGESPRGAVDLSVEHPTPVLRLQTAADLKPPLCR